MAYDGNRGIRISIRNVVGVHEGMTMGAWQLAFRNDREIVGLFLSQCIHKSPLHIGVCGA